MGQCDGIDFATDDKVAWQYCPSFAPAVLYAVIFFILTVVHTVQAFTLKKKFSWVIITCGVWETAAFALRAAGSKDIYKEAFGTPHQILVALSPLWLNAFVYMVLGRMIYFFLPDKRCFGITARRLTLIFVLLDVVAFLVQGSSVTLMNSDNDAHLVRIGIDVYMGGIGLQEFFILVFIGLAVRFQKKMTAYEKTAASPFPWRPLLYSVYAGLVLISIRIIYRLIEYSDGFYSAIATKEAAFYVLDASSMAVAMLVFNIFHPGRYLVGPDSEFPKKEKKEKKNKKAKKGKNDNRSWREVFMEDGENRGTFEQLPLHEVDRDVHHGYENRGTFEQLPLHEVDRDVHHGYERRSVSPPDRYYV